MRSRWFNVAVVVLWLSTMSWLLTQKVLPTTLPGEPPAMDDILKELLKDPVVGWSMAWDGRPLGWATIVTTPLEHQMTEVRSRVHFDRLPLSERSPEWLKSMLAPLADLRNEIKMEAQSTMVFDPLRRLSRFESAVRFPPMEAALKVRGNIDGPKMSLSVHCGDFTYDADVPTPPGMLSDAMSPQGKLPGLREGQTWTVRVFSPLAAADAPMDVLQVTVEGREPVVWEGRPVSAWLVVYRSDPGSHVGPGDRTRARLWVAANGTVLKQEIMLFGSVMAFTRLSAGEAAALAEREK